MRARKRTLAEQAATRELIVLTDGPWRGRWYWGDEFAKIQESAHRYPPEHPSGQLQSYQPTKSRASHPDDPSVSGTAYRYQPGKTA